MRATKAKYGLRARFLSDANMNASPAFRIAYHVDAETLAQLASNGIDLDVASGKHHQLPVPAIYSVAANGRIQFAYVQPDMLQYRAWIHMWDSTNELNPLAFVRTWPTKTMAKTSFRLPTYCVDLRARRSPAIGSGLKTGTPAISDTTPFIS